MKTFDQVLAEKIETLHAGEWPIGNLILCAIALVLSILLCGAIGLEREFRGRNAGLRTHVLVGVGSCLIMIVSIYGFPYLQAPDGTYFNRDVARLAAQVITGVGFLGAGAIIHRSSGARGLTTAATIWIVMAIGLACGSMNFLLATGGTAIILIFLVVFKNYERAIIKRSPRVVVHTAIETPIIGQILTIASRNYFHIEEVRTDLNEDGTMEISFIPRTTDSRAKVEDIIPQLEKIENVLSVRLISNQK